MGKLLSFTLLFGGFFYLYNKIRDFVKSKQKKMLLEKNQLKKQQDYLSKLKGYNTINNYSICLSFDYKTNRKVTSESKEIISKVIVAKTAKMLSIVFPNLEVKNMQDALMILSSDFEMYDKIYGTVLKILSKIKKEVDDRYSIYMLASITTDAYAIRPDLEIIKQNHSNIKHCNFVNKSTISKMFSNKYGYLKKSKYMGVPIGEYSILDNEKTNTYELNMVCKDLSYQLESMGQ